MVARTEEYVDTSALIAFVDSTDIYHRLFARLFSDPPPLLTSVLVIAEGHAWFVKRFDSVRALQFLAMVEDLPQLRVMAVGEKELDGASVLLRKFSDQKLTLTDALGLSLMKDRKIKCCWSTDFHLSLTGVRLAIH